MSYARELSAMTIMDGELPPLSRLPEDWERALARHGGPRYRALQVFRWIWARGVTDPERMSDLPKTLRGALAGSVPALAPPATVMHTHRSLDGSRKLVLGLADGAEIETVLLPVLGGAETLDADAAAADDDGDDGDDEDGALADARADARPGPLRRVTQCVSTQVGCAMACTFCASGLAGLRRHLDASEIAGQVLLGRAACGPDEVLRSVVFMGMGEPLHNYAGTARAIRLLSHPEGLAIPLRRITVSTSGLVPEIAELGRDFGGAVGLAVSLHQADDVKRSALMPVNRRYGLGELGRALGAYPLPPRRRITVEYTLLAGENDAPEDARALVRFLRPLRAKVNLIPMNRITGSTLGPPDPARVLAFQRVVADAGIGCFVRRRRGDDVAAACGQLALDPTRGAPRRASARRARDA